MQFISTNGLVGNLEHTHKSEQANDEIDLQLDCKTKSIYNSRYGNPARKQLEGV
jgi:hypothetical protein